MRNRERQAWVWETIDDTWDIELRDPLHGRFYLGEVFDLEDAMEIVNFLKEKGLIQDFKVFGMDPKVKRAVDGPEY